MDPSDEAKRASIKRVISNQVDSDFALAMQIQEEESSSSSSSSSEQDSDESYNEGYEFFDSLGFEEDLGFLEDEEMEEEEEEEDEEDEIDPDEMSYEELLALGEMVGAGRRGLSEKEISGCLTAAAWRREAAGIERCVVCQVEYEEGDEVVALGGCKHEYHLDCISKWLGIKNMCPICSHQPI